jgi:ElaB/YqjD/DUF883 family membrane-anchored ribosome-binding protein
MTATLEKQIVHDFTPGRAGMAGALRDTASRLGEEVKQTAMDRVVRPTLEAARHAGEAVEQRARAASQAVQDGMHQLQESALKKPRQTLAFAFCTGLLIGLLIHRR